MNVLVTGGAGYIGSEVCRILVERNHNVTVLDTLYFGTKSLDELKDKVTIIEGDIRNSVDVSKALRGQNAVIHLAGIVGAPACSANPTAHHLTNDEATKTLVNLCTSPEFDMVRDFIFASSCSVYGNVKGIFSQVSEDTATSPLSSYADAKIKSEKVILDKSAEVPQFHPTILRLTTLFGFSNRQRLDLVTNQFCHKSWKDETIEIFGGGAQYRSLIHVKDVARAFVQTLEAPRFIRENQIFHVGDENNNITVKEIAETVKKVNGSTKITYSNDGDFDARDYKINCSKIKNTIGWHAEYSVEDGIRQMMSVFKEKLIDLNDDNFTNVNVDYL